VFGIHNGEEIPINIYWEEEKKVVPLMWLKEFLTHVVFGEQHMSASEDATVGTYRRSKFLEGDNGEVSMMLLLQSCQDPPSRRGVLFQQAP
jgi:hypothetical protein